MADTKASDEPAAAALEEADGFAVVQGGADRFATLAQVVARVLASLADADPLLAANSASKLPSQSAVRAYVTSQVEGRSWKPSVRAATAAALPANTYANGTAGVGATLTGSSNGALAAQDGVTLVAQDRLLVKDEAAPATNGLYALTQAGSAGAPYVLTRVADSDTAAELLQASGFVQEGTANGDKQFVLTTNAPITVGTTALVFTVGGTAAGDTYTNTAASVDGEAALFSGTTGKLLKRATGTGLVKRTSGVDTVVPQVQFIGGACSDETTPLTAGTAKVTFINPFDTAFVVAGVKASLTVAQTSGSILTVDVNEAGTSILSTKLTVDNTEKTSATAATPAVVSDSSIAANAEFTVDIDQVGDGTAKGLKVYILGWPA